MNQPFSPRAYSYLRFSTTEQLKGDSLRRQTDLAEAFAKRYGLLLDTELNLQDLGVSAFRGANSSRGALGLFLRAIEDGLIEPGSVLILESLDRLSRQGAWDTMPTLQLILNAGVRLGIPPDRFIDLESVKANPWLLMEMLMGLVRAREESETKSRRLKAAWDAKRAKAGNEALTSQVPGWVRMTPDRKMELIPERVAVVRKIIKWTLAGDGANTIVRRLNAEGAPRFRSAKYWYTSYIRRILENPALVGQFVPHVQQYEGGKLKRHPQEPVQDYYPRVIDDETYALLTSELRKSPLRGRHAQGLMGNLLSGVAHCSKCGASMVRINKGKRTTPGIVCARAKVGGGCEYQSIRLSVIEDTFKRHADYIAASSPVPDEAAEKAYREAEAEVDHIAGQLEELSVLLESNPSVTLASSIAALEVALGEARKAREAAFLKVSLASTALNTAKTEELRKALEDTESADKRRANLALRSLVKRVTVNAEEKWMVLEWQLGGMLSLQFGFPAADGTTP